MTAPFGWDGVAARTLFSVFVVFAAYNPSGRSYWHWMWAGETGFWVKLATGLALLLVHLAIWLTLLGLFGWLGVLLLATMLGIFTMALLELTGGTAGGAWPGLVPLVLLSLLYAMGLSWSMIHHRIAGIVHVAPTK
jgi:hypothetical protein